MHKYQNINCNHQTGAILVLGIYWIELVYAHQNLWKLSYFRTLRMPIFYGVGICGPYFCYSPIRIFNPMKNKISINKNYTLN